MQTRNSKLLVTLGFAFILVLMVALTLIGLTRMAEINQHMDAIVNEQNVKIDLISTMRHAARERTILLHRIAVMTDPFERDEELQKFSAAASEFIQARIRLTAMHLNPTEKRTLEHSLEIARDSSDSQQQVVDLLLRDRPQEANQMLLQMTVPLQNHVLAKLSELLEMQRATARTAAIEAEEDYRGAFRLMIGLGLSAVALGILIAVFVIRRTAKIEHDLFQEKVRAEVTLHSIGDAVIATDTNGRVEFLNPVAQKMTGWDAQAAKGLPLGQVFRTIDEHTREPLAQPSNIRELDGQAIDTEQYAILIAREGNEFSIEQTVAPTRDFEGRTIGAVLVFRDVSRSREMARQLNWAATHDALTGLVNRREFERRLHTLLESARFEHKQHALVYLDLDQFKVVNDTCGHLAGDELLRQLALTLDKKVRTSDTLARLGGDEFGVLLDGCPIERAASIAEAMRVAIADFRFVWQDKVFEVGVSIGVAPVTDQCESPARIMSTADAACYVAKDLGRNRVHVSLPDDQEMSQRQGEMQWVHRISQALEANRLRLYYQSIVPIGEDAAGETHYEVLLRLIDENGKVVPPMAFIPAAERYNLMPSIDRWVIRTILAHLAAGKNDSNLTCSINLSGQSLGDDHMLDFIVDQIDHSGVAPECLCFEITETSAIANLSRATRFISVLRGMGCRFSLDDFGSGMSSFGYLKHLHVDYLKIDGTFVRDMVDDVVDRAMVEAINRIGHVMGIRTIAEFVENNDILQKLKEIGVDYAQGYGIHKPEPLQHTLSAPAAVAATA